MAATQKKKTNTKTKTAVPKRPAKPKYDPVARLVGGIVCLLLMLCVAVSYFNVEAVFLTFFAKLLKGLVGYGYYLAAPAFLWAGIILLNHQGRPVTARVVCAVLLPLVFGVVMHLILCRGDYTLAMEDLKRLWSDGQTLASGGLFSGAIAAGSMKLLSKIVSIMVYIIVLVVLVFVAGRVKLRDLVSDAKERVEERKEEIVDEPVEPVRTSEETNEKRKSRPIIDIPLDGEKRAARKAEKAEKADSFVPPKITSFYAEKPEDVKTPAEVLGGEAPQAPVVKEKKMSAKQLEKSEVDDAAAEVAKDIEKELAEPENEYQYPPITLLTENRGGNFTEVGAELRNNARRLADTLNSFGVDAQAGEVIHGPSVTRYEFTLDQGVKLSKITNLSDDIALALGASGVRIAPVPGKIAAVGIEVPNRAVTDVRIRDIIESRDFVEAGSRTSFAIGKDIGGNSIVGNIGKLPHVLIAGTTGSGKSVCTNSLIISLLYKATPEEVRFIMVDPKMVELAPYNGIPHLLIPVVTDPKKAAGALQWAVFEMMKRYKIFSEHGIKDLAGYNALVDSPENEEGLKKMPSVVVVIDELADLMLVAAKEVEESICRVAQMGRAAGVHLVIATQRPSADVITGLMKANIPSRIAFAVASSLESRIILDTTGAEKLVGRGDMLYFPLGANKPTRVQGCFITPEEIEKVVAFVKEQSGEASYDQEVINKIDEALRSGEKGKGGGASESSEADGDGYDELLCAAVEVILETGQASVSMLQRRLKLGYSRAARLVDQMEEKGIVGPFEGSKPRQLLISRAKWEEMKMQGGDVGEEAPADTYGSIRDAFESHDALE